MTEHQHQFWRAPAMARVESIRDRLSARVYYRERSKCLESDHYNWERSQGMSRMNPSTPEDVLRAVLERSHWRRNAGQEYLVRPKLVTEIFGNGKTLLILTPCMTSVPDYYVVRIDGRWDLNNDGRGELLFDHIDDIYESIEGEFDFMSEDEVEELQTNGGSLEREWPRAYFGMGSSWGSTKWPLKSEVNERQIQS